MPDAPQPHHETQAHYRAALEAILLVSDGPRTAAELAAALQRAGGEEVTEAVVDACIETLRGEYAARGAGLVVERWAEGYRLATHPDVAAYVEAAQVEEQRVRLSGALLEALAVIAYKQPVTRPEVDFVRGVDSGYAVTRLAEHGLITVVGQADTVGRPLLYGTTPLFLETFGLESLDGLPSLREIEELLSDPAFSRERARLLTLRTLDDAPSSPADSDDAFSTPSE